MVRPLGSGPCLGCAGDLDAAVGNERLCDGLCHRGRHGVADLLVLVALLANEHVVYREPLEDGGLPGSDASVLFGMHEGVGVLLEVRGDGGAWFVHVELAVLVTEAVQPVPDEARSLLVELAGGHPRLKGLVDFPVELVVGAGVVVPRLDAPPGHVLGPAAKADLRE